MLLSAMYTMEESPSLLVGENNMVITTDKAIVLEQLPIGKTLTSIALIAHTIDEPVKSDHCSYVNKAFNTCTYQCSGHLVSIMELIDMTVIPWTIIITNSTGVETYTDILDRYTDINYMKISGESDISSLITLLEAGQQDNISVVIIKHRTLKNANDTSIIRRFKEVTEGIKFKRCIIDDFNDIKLNYNDPLLCVDFTWFICNHQRNANGSIKNNASGNMTKFIRESYYNDPILQVCNDDNIMRFFTIQFDSNFLKKFYKLPLVKSYSIPVNTKNKIFKHQNVLLDSLTKLINTNRITELADYLKLSCTSIENLCSILLSEDYVYVSNTLEYIDKVIQQSWSDSKQNSIYIKEMYNILKRNKKVPARIKQDGAIEICNKLKIELEQEKTRLLNPLKRLQENIQDYECQCCFVPFDELDNHVFTLHCCQVVLCVDCIFINRSRLINKCPKCCSSFKTLRVPIHVKNMSYINFDINDIKSVNDVNAKDIRSITCHTDPHILTLLELLTSENLSNAKKILDDDNLRLLYKDIDTFGIYNMPCKQESYLVYTSKKSIDFVTKEMDPLLESKLKDMRIQITSNYKTIESAKDITTIIFFDNININEKQKVINRVQTIGRSHNLTIYRLTKTH
jgi:hypothetical protein